MTKDNITIFFDLDDTLVNNTRAQKKSIFLTLKKFFNDLEYSENIIGKNWQTISNYYYDLYFKGIINIETQRNNRITQLFYEFNLEVDDIDLSCFYNEYYKSYLNECIIFNDVRNCLKHFKSHSLGIISNGLYNTQKTKLVNNSIDHFFDFLITSDKVGFNKPNIKIFENAAALTSSSTCVFVGDLYEIDAIGALNAGFKSVWLNRNNLIINDIKRDIHVINSLDELPNLMENIL